MKLNQTEVTSGVTGILFSANQFSVPDLEIRDFYVEFTFSKLCDFKLLYNILLYNNHFKNLTKINHFYYLINSKRFDVCAQELKCVLETKSKAVNERFFLYYYQNDFFCLKKSFKSFPRKKTKVEIPFPVLSHCPPRLHFLLIR